MPDLGELPQKPRSGSEGSGGGVWYGLTHRGAEGNPSERQRVIVDRLVRWATRDGEDGSQAASAVLDEYLTRR